MDRDIFTTYMTRARLVGGDYGAGYQRGLRRHYHGERFGTEAEHRHWLALGTEPGREELGRGYQDGYAGHPPALTDRLAAPDRVG